MTDLLLDLDTARIMIQAVNLEPVIDRLVKVEGWYKTDAKAAVRQYRHYLYLRRKYPEKALPPSQDIDEAWQAHVILTRRYRDFCRDVFPDFDNQFLDHVPIQFEPEMDPDLLSQLAVTQQLYQQEFGQPLYRIKGRSLLKRIVDTVRDALFGRH